MNEKKLEDLKARQAQIKSKLGEIEEQIKAAYAKGGARNEVEVLFLEGKKADAEFDAISREIEQLENEIKLQRTNDIYAKRQATVATSGNDEQELKYQAKETVKLDKAFWTESESKMKRGINRTAEDIINALKVQITPSTECVEMNDKFVKKLFNHSAEKFARLISGKKFGIVERKARIRKGKRQDEIVSSYKVQNAEGYEDDTPLDEFDRAVLGVIFSEFVAGNRYSTVNIIFRALIGQVGNQNVRPRPNQRDAIVNSVIRLMAHIVDFRNFSDSFADMHYTDKDGNELKFGVESLLSAGIVDAKINGQEMDGVIYFKDSSPLFDIADAKDQIIRYPHELLNVPNLNNTPRIIALKKYVMRRICEIKLHKQLVPTITFDDVFKKCRMENSHREVKRDARNAIVKLFEHLKENNFITDFQLLKNTQTQKFVSIKFSY